jgi:hypothetical protein
MATKRQPKQRSRKETQKKVSTRGAWTVWRGKLVPPPGRPQKVPNLFKVVAEKIPFPCLADVEKDVKEQKLPTNGIYLAHDSMGAVRYVGRGNIFGRLRTRLKAQPLELAYFSFYGIADNHNKKHEREVETLVIRASSHLLEFNEKKKRPTISPGDVRDYEPGTCFYERQKKKGNKTDA